MNEVVKIKQEIKTCQEVKEANNYNGGAESIHHWLNALRREHELQNTLSKIVEK